MSPDTLGKIRKVYPAQSKACKVLGYTLTFAHIGLPYIEPGFGTIEPLSLHPVPPTLKIAASCLNQSATSSEQAMLYSTPPAALAKALKAEVVSGDSTQADHATLARQQAQVNGDAAPELPLSFDAAALASPQGRGASDAG